MTVEAAFFGVVARVETKTAKASGKPYLRIAVRDGDGESATWISVMVFDPDLVVAADKITKGSKLYVEGNLKLDRWQASDGSGEKTGLSVMANHVRIPAIGRNKPKRDGDGAPTPQQTQRSNNFHSDEIGF